MTNQERKGGELEKEILSANEIAIEQFKMEHANDIELLENIDYPESQLAQIILVLFGAQPAVDVFPDSAEQSELFKKIFDRIGLSYTETQSTDLRGRQRSVLFVAKTPEDAEALLETNPGVGARIEHEKYAQLMGFPQTAIDAFVGRIPVSDYHATDPRLIFHFKFSQEHQIEEEEYLLKQSLLVKKLSPKIYDKIIKARLAMIDRSKKLFNKKTEI